MKNHSIIGLILFLLMSTSAFAYDTEINGLRYDWVSYYNASKTSGDVKLVGYSSSYLGESLTIPCSVKWNERKKGTEGRNCQVCRVESNAFENCTILKSVDFGCVQDVNSNAFKNCTSLQTIYFSNTIISILPLSFSGCTSITEIHIDKNTPPIIYDENAFDEVIYNNCIVFVPEGSLNAYKNADIWKKFANITDGKSNTYTLSVSATGNGSATYDGTAVKGKTSTFNVIEGTDATITFSPDNGYRIKSVKVNSTDVTSKVISNKYTISNISSDTTVEVVFEVKESTSVVGWIVIGESNYESLDSFDGWTQWGEGQEDAGSKIECTAEGLAITLGWQTGQLWQPQIMLISDGSFNLEAGDNYKVVVTAKFPSDGTLMVNMGTWDSNVPNTVDVTSTGDFQNIEIDFSDWPSTLEGCHLLFQPGDFLGTTIVKNIKILREERKKYNLTIKATGNGSATYDGTTIKNKTNTFTVIEGTPATIKFTPDDGNRIKSVKLDDKDVTSSVTNNRYTISEIAQNMTLEVTFEETPKYTLDLIVSGNGVVKHKNLSYRNKTQQFIGPEGYSLTFQLEPDDGCRIASVKENDKDVTSSIVDNQYTVSNIKENKTLSVKFEAIPPTTYTLSIKATGNGSASYDGTTIKNKTNTFTVTEGTSATITFTPDSGYRIESVKVNSTDVTSKVSGNKYTISSISSNTTVEVVFEAIPPTTYTLSITATGNGSASYDGTTIKNKTNTFTLTEGSSATITFTPDSGYRIKSVKVNSTDVTSKVSGNKYTISSISSNTTVEVVFEAIPPTTYTLSITATGNGSASYDGTTIKNKTNTFTVTEGTSATIAFTPDSGYRIKSVKVNSTDVTSSVSNNTYSFKIGKDTSVEVEFEAIPPTTYTLSIKTTGNGSATYDGTTVRSKTSTFTVNDGTNVTITFTPDNGYRIKSVKVGNSDVTSSISNNSYSFKISNDTSVEVEFEVIPPTTYTLSITAIGNGSATYDGATVRSKTSTFNVNDGTNVTITFSPDNGYRIKSVKVGSTDVTSKLSSNKYTISSISGDASVEVEFEAIPPTTYTLSIKATGNGSALYDGTTIKNNTSSFTVTEGTSATITFTPDNGCRIKSVKINNFDVTSSIVNSSFTINNISRNTDVEFEFEIIPSTTYTLSISATGNGSATYEGTVIKGKTSSFTVNEGANATITFTPDNGYRIKSVKENDSDVTSKVVNNAYIVTNISSNTTVDVVFEAIPATAYTLSIKATGNGSVTYDGTSVRGKTSSFTVNGGTSATITLSADNGNRIKSVKINNSDVTSKLMNNSYTISNISDNTTVEVVFEEIIAELTNDGVYYSVVSDAQQTVIVAGGDFGLTLDVPASFTAKNKEWKVVGVEADVLSNPELAAIIWNPEVAFNGIVNNPNLLLYVKDKKYAPDDIQNVVVNGEADVIVLQDAEDGNNFYCPQEFTAKRISYIHRYSMKTGFKTCQGWETIVLPFDVTTILSATGTEIVPYIAWQQGSSSRPFWLYSLNENGWKAESGIKANTPYIISMPNNEEYDATYNLSGDIQFMGSNVQVLSSDNLSASKFGNKQLVSNYQNKVASQDIYALNVNSQLNTNTATETEGSAFIRSLRQVRPFEAYMTIEGGAGARRAIPIFDEDTNGIQTIPWSTDRSDDAIYNLNGQRVNSMTRGIYIQNGKKIFKK